jgi:TonB family protein
MRQAVLGSSAVHLALLGTLFAVRMAPPIVVPGPDVVQVALVDPIPGAVAQPTPAPPEPEPAPATVTPDDETGVRITPPKPQKKPAEKREEPPTPAAAPAPALPLANVGTSGLRGQISLDTNFEFTYYLLLVRNRVAQSWAPPAGLTSGGTPVRTTVYFRIGRDGGVSSVRLESASGYEFFDRSAIRAIQLSDPMPPLPLGYGGGDLGVHFGFEFVAP